MACPTLILASSSRWRRQLMDRLQLTYQTISPDIDETPRPGEAADRLVMRLARAKAQIVYKAHCNAVVIGSDQVAGLDGAIIGKPGTRENAIKQLQRQSGRTVIFHTGVCVYSPTLDTPLVAHVPVETVFRDLGDDEIARYVDTEDVTTTAGCMKSEGLGITLVEQIRSDDPTALIGLPLITLRRLLAQAGVNLP